VVGLLGYITGLSPVFQYMQYMYTYTAFTFGKKCLLHTHTHTHIYTRVYIGLTEFVAFCCT